MFFTNTNIVKLAIILSFFFLSTNIFLISQTPATTLAQNDKATISGKVSDAETGDVLIGVTIYVDGTKLGGKTKVDGSYTIKNVPAGTYKLTYNYIGYQKKAIENVVLVAGETKKVNVLLSADKVLSEEVVVEAVRTNDNEASVLLQRKNASSVSDGISKEEMQRLPDSDAGQSLKRVSGITLVDNKFIYVRGVSERYSNTTLNGASLTSTEPDKKAFSFDMFPSEFLQNVTVNKSFTPDLPGNFAGGLVQLNTVDFPEGFSIKTSVSNSINTNVNFVDNAVVGSPRSSTDWLAEDDGMRAAPSDIPIDRKAFNELRRDANDPSNTLAQASYEKVSKGFNSNNWAKETNTLGFLGNNSFGLSYTDLLEVFGNQFGIIGSVNYATSNSRNNLDRNTYQSNLDSATFFNGFTSTQSVSLGGMVNMAYRLDNNNTISFKNVYNRSADDEYLNLAGKDIFYQQQDIRSYSFQYVQKEMYSGQLGGEHLFSLSEDIKSTLDWKAGYSLSTRQEPDFRRLKFARNLSDLESDPNYPFYADIQSTQQGDGARAGRFYSDLNDEAFNANFNYTIPLDNTFKIKVGAWVEQRKRDFDARSFTIVTNETGLDADVDAVAQDWQNPQNLFKDENFRLVGGYQMSEDSRLSDSYTASEDLYAAYAMTDFPFEVEGEDFRFIGGVRIEDNTQRLNSFNTNDTPLEVNRPITDVLPSINMLWKANDKTNVRASATQTLTRPSIREFAPFAFFDYLQQALVQGNPNIRRALIQNYDLRYEYFPNIGEVISFSLFYKNFTDAIEETIFPAQSELTRSFANAQGNAVNYGIELEFRKSLNFISEDLSSFAFSSNFALITSEIEVPQGDKIDKRQMWGQSPYSVNLGLFYTSKDYGTSVNVAYNTYGKRIIQVAQQGVYVANDPHVYELPRDLVDFSITQPLFDNIEMKFAARDILNQRLIWEQAGRVVATNLRGSNYSLGISYKIK